MATHRRRRATASSTYRLADRRTSLMSIIVMHLRFNDLAAAQVKTVDALLDVAELSSTCWSRASRADGTALLMTLVWENEASALTFTDGLLAAAVSDACLDEPQVVMFAVPDLFAPAYRRRAAVSIPTPRDTTEAPNAVAMR
jgi:hypothetical protein